MHSLVFLALFAAGPALAQDLVVDGTTVVLDGIQTYESVSVVNGGVLEVTVYDGSGTTGTLKIVADSVLIDGTSSIVAGGRGYRGIGRANGEGPGGGQGGDCCQDSGGGGGHGGDGGTGSRDWGGGVDGAGGSAYGNPTSHDINMGSAGGAAGSADADAGGPGGNAGGSVWIQASVVTIQGSIATNGSNGINHGNDAAGGGAGGGILIEAGTLDCTGSLIANGGDGAVVDDAGGGGGGGVVKQFYDAVVSTCSVSVSGGITSRGATGGGVGIASTAVFDYDGDGYTSSAGDCDPADASIYPGATEVCDGADNDCDTTIDEPDAADASTWYADTDADGYGDAASTTTACVQPSAYVADATDCDDANGAVNLGATEVCNGIDDDCDGDIDEAGATGLFTWYADSDGDGYGDLGSTMESCTQPTGYVADDTDCDDANAAVSPAAPETCNGIDDDCGGDIDEDDATDATTWYTDADHDGFGNDSSSTTACQQPPDTAIQGGDCDDLRAASYPGAPETWYDGIDDDCDGASDYDADSDGHDSDGHGGDDCDDTDASVYPDAVETWYDGVDADCDGASDNDADGDGFDSASYGGDDCDDSRPDTYPGAPDVPHDGEITDCNRSSDDDADGDGFDSVEYGGDDCDDANSAVNPDADETWYDGLDDDCDGNDDDQDEDGFAIEDDCDDTDDTIYPGAPGWSEDCEPIDTDTGVIDTALDTGFDTGADASKLTGGNGCVCSSTSGHRSPVFAAFLMGLVFVRRRRTGTGFRM